jgi:alkylation response protein AidB-like acyl-CoA dehydrogenase
MAPTQFAATERDDLRDAVRHVVSRRLPVSRSRSVSAGDGFDDEAWRIAVELGWLGIGVPEEFGGSGGTFADLAVVLEELGGVVAPGALFSATVLGIGAVVAAGSPDQCATLLPQLVRGSRRLTAAVPAPDASTTDRASVHLIESETGLRVTGSAGLVLDARSADGIIVPVRDGEGVSLVLVAPAAAGVDIVDTSMVDTTRRLSDVALRDVPVDSSSFLGPRGRAEAALTVLGDRAAAGLAADSVGGMNHLLSAVVTYVGQREQFGRPIGSFQAVKHHCADMLILLETARAAARRCAAEAEGSERTLWAAIAGSTVQDAYADLTRIAVQCFGGIGFTWEFDAHLYLKRARLNQHLFGSTTAHRRRLARLLAEQST